MNIDWILTREEVNYDIVYLCAKCGNCEVSSSVALSERGK